jgi:hypothetical protein
MVDSRSATVQVVMTKDWDGHKRGDARDVSREEWGWLMVNDVAVTQVRSNMERMALDEAGKADTITVELIQEDQRHPPGTQRGMPLNEASRLVRLGIARTVRRPAEPQPTENEHGSEEDPQ